MAAFVRGIRRTLAFQLPTVCGAEIEPPPSHGINGSAKWRIRTGR
jgi:hypothetical protein